MITLHFNAIKNRLLQDPALVGRVYDSTVPLNSDGTVRRDTYVVMYGGTPENLASNRFTAPQLPDSDADFVYTIRQVATTPYGVRSLATHVMAQLVGFVPVIAGRDCRVRLTHAPEMEEDVNVKPSLFYSDDEYTLTSMKA